MIRLAEARARCELREWVTVADAADAVDLVKESMFDSYSNDAGVADFRRASGRSGGALGEAKRLMGAMEARGRERGDVWFSMAEVCLLADELRLAVPCVMTLVDRLNEAGDLLKVGRKYRLLGVV